MGLCTVLHELDPGAVTDVASAGPQTVDEVRAALGRFGRDDPAALELSSWEELEDLVEAFGSIDSEAVARLAIVGAASRATWDLDKAPSAAFTTLFARAPALSPVARLFGGEAWLPGGMSRADEHLVHVARDDEVRAAHDAIRPWLDDGARARIAALPGTALSRWFGADRKHAAEWLDAHDYAWGAWRRLGDALQGCAARRTWLGVVVG